jgi:uncharacterized membrane protein YeiH
MGNWIILLLDLFGTAVFAITGAVQGIRRHLDIFGVTVLACCVGVGGGITRDCIIGCTPVAAFQNQHYILICIAVGILSYMSAGFLIKKRNIVKFCDAIGLGVFTAIGAQKGMDFGLTFTGIVLCGVFTSVGGGIIRDVLTGKIPVVLKSDFYATASLIGGIVFCLLLPLKLHFFLNFLIVAALVTAIRLIAIRYNIQLPAAGRFNNRSAH